MSKVIWNEAGKKFFEFGVDRGVLYPTPSTGVPWNGLTSVEDGSDGGETTSLYLDGFKYLDLVSNKDYRGVINAYTFPDEFLAFNGTSEIVNGVFATNQPIVNTFSLSYRTSVGNDQNDFSHGYKLNLLYNLTATPEARTFETRSEELTPTDFSWTITGTSIPISGIKPTCHLIIDSRKIHPRLLADIETILYGDETTEPRMPLGDELVEFFTNWALHYVTDNGDGTWSAEGPDDLINVNSDGSFTINQIESVYLTPNTYTITTK